MPASPAASCRLVAARTLVRVERGLNALPDRLRGEYSSLAMVARALPRSQFPFPDSGRRCPGGAG